MTHETSNIPPTTDAEFSEVPNDAVPVGAVPAQPLAVIDVSPAGMLAHAVAQNAPLEYIEKLMDLKDRWDAKQARNAFVRDMAAFKANPPTILKEKLVSFPTKDANGRVTDEVSYKHATLGAVCAAIVSSMGAHGFSHRWDIKREGDRIHVTCTITHREGHSESVTLDGSPDTSGKKNALQQNASTVTYLQRYTLLAATGLATEDAPDDDGGGGSDATISIDQIADIELRIKELSVDRDAFLDLCGVEKIEHILGADFDKTMHALDRKEAALKKAGKL